MAVYARASKDRSELRISVDRQVARGTKLAGELFPGLEAVVYADNNLSGADPDVDRPGYNELLAAIRRGDVAEVVCHEQSRLTRQPGQWDELVIVLHKAGIAKVHTVMKGVVPVEPGNRLVGRIMAVVDAEEAERTKARTLAAHQQLAGEGRPNGGRCYGYQRTKGDDGRPALEVDVDQAAVVVRIVDAICTGQSISSVVAELNAEGVATAQGGSQWRPSAVKSIVTKPAIAGLRSHKGVILGGARWDPIITEERWRQVARALGSPVVYDAQGRARKAPRGHRGSGRRWLLTGGLARCGLCGSRLVVGGQRARAGQEATTGRRWNPAYQCHFSVADACCKVSVTPADVVETLVVGAVLDALEQQPAMGARLADEPDPERNRLLAEIHEAEDTVHRAAELRGAGDIDWDTWETMHRPAKARADGARSRLASLSDPDVDLPPADQIRDRWELMPLRQRRALLERFLVSVEVGPRISGGHRPGTVADRVAERLTLRWRA